MAEPPQSVAEIRVRRALAHHPAVRDLADGPLVAVHGGLGNDAWSAEHNGVRCFVRLGAAGAAEFGVDRGAECALLGAVAAAGFAPGVIACDAETGLLVTDFVEGRSWSVEDAGREANLRRIGALLRRLHAHEIPRHLRTVSFEQQAAGLGARLAGLVDDRACDVALRDRAQPVFARLAGRPPSRTVCHNDVHHLNVIDTGSRLWLVDWEYGGLGDPLFDLASVLCQHELDEHRKSVFLDAYGLGGDERGTALADACWVFDYVQWLWYRLWLQDHRDPEGTGAARRNRLALRFLRCNNGALDAGKGDAWPG